MKTKGTTTEVQEVPTVEQSNVEQFKVRMKTHRVPTLKDVINGDYDPTELERLQLANMLGSGCQMKNKKRIKSVCLYGLSSLPNWGIMERVIFKGHMVQYVAGQSYPDEIRTVRSAFTR